MIFASQNNHHNQVKKKMERIKLGNPFVQNKWIKVRNETSLISFGRYSYTDTQTCAHRCTHRETGYTQTHWHSVMHLTETGRHLDPTAFFRRGVGTCPLKSAQFLCVPPTAARVRSQAVGLILCNCLPWQRGLYLIMKAHMITSFFLPTTEEIYNQPGCHFGQWPHIQTSARVYHTHPEHPSEHTLMHWLLSLLSKMKASRREKSAFFTNAKRK